MKKYKIEEVVDKYGYINHAVYEYNDKFIGEWMHISTVRTHETALEVIKTLAKLSKKSPTYFDEDGNPTE